LPSLKSIVVDGDGDGDDPGLVSFSTLPRAPVIVAVRVLGTRSLALPALTPPRQQHRRRAAHGDEYVDVIRVLARLGRVRSGEIVAVADAVNDHAGGATRVEVACSLSRGSRP
jgi:hypothetical protein